ncbi:MAG: TetR/AcrR family transcriptional regulator [Haloferacaceae archaeon]
MNTDTSGTDTREQLMRATYRVLAERGFANLTTQRVADEADCSQSLVHYHYDTKEDLVVTFLEWVLEQETEWLEGLADGSAERRLRRFLDAQLSIPVDEEHARFNVAFVELATAAARNERYRAVLTAFSERQQATLVEIIRDGIEAGEFSEVPAESTARFLRYALQGAVQADLTLDDPEAKSQTEAAVDAYVEGMLLGGRD